MNQRFQDASATVRVTFTDSGVTREFWASFSSSKQFPVVVGFERLARANSIEDAGGKLTLESLSPVRVDRCAAPKLPVEFEEEIETWLRRKRQQLVLEAVSLREGGAKAIRVNPQGTIAAHG